MKKVVLISLIITINVVSKIIPIETNYEYVRVSINPDNKYGEITGFEIINDTIYIYGSENEYNLLFDGFYSFKKMSTDYGETWKTIDSTLYTVENINTLQRVKNQIISGNNLYYFSEDVSGDKYTLKKTTNYGETWIENKLNDIEGKWCNACFMHKTDKSLILSYSMEYFKSSDEGKTWQTYQRNLPDSLKNGFRSMNSQLLNDSIEYVVLQEGYSYDESRRKYFMTFNINQNKVLSVLPRSENFAFKMYLKNKDEFYLMGTTHEDPNDSKTILVKTENQGITWDTVFIDHDVRVTPLRINKIVNKNGHLIFGISGHIYISDKNSKDFYRIRTPDTVPFEIVDMDSKGNIYATNHLRTSYYKFSNPFTSVQDNNPFGEQSIEIMVYPNPATDEIEITGIENAITQEIEIFNIFGEKVISTQLTASNKVNVSLLPTGMYIVKIGDRVTKFIKE